jgi:hypothetical protein
MNPMAEYLIQTRRNPLPNMQSLPAQLTPAQINEQLKTSNVNKAREIAAKQDEVAKKLQESAADTSAAKGLSTGAKVGIGVGILALVGGGVWFYTSRK